MVCFVLHNHSPVQPALHRQVEAGWENCLAGNSRSGKSQDHACYATRTSRVSARTLLVHPMAAAAVNVVTALKNENRQFNPGNGNWHV